MTLGPVQQRILNLLSRAGSRGLTSKEIVEMVYGPSGAKGPLDPHGTLLVILKTLRQKGYDIEHRSFFRLNSGVARRPE